MVHLDPSHPFICRETKNNKDLKTQQQDHHELLYFYSNQTPGSNLLLCQASFVFAVPSGFVGREGVNTLLNQGALCISPVYTAGAISSHTF